MKTTFLHTVLLCLFCYSVYPQSSIDYKDGYALKEKDTVWCKVYFNTGSPDFSKNVRLIIDGEEMIFLAGSAITGFGFEENKKRHDYGTVEVETQAGTTMVKKSLFVRKLVAGTIDLYEYSYLVYSTRRRSSGTGPPTEATTTQKYFTYNYIAKADSAAPALAIPVLLSILKKKEIAAYVSDNADMFAKLDKAVSVKQLADILREYNKWYKNNIVNR